MADPIERTEALKALKRVCDKYCKYPKACPHTHNGACPLGYAFEAIENLRVE